MGIGSSQGPAAERLLAIHGLTRGKSRAAAGFRDRLEEYSVV